MSIGEAGPPGVVPPPPPPPLPGGQVGQGGWALTSTPITKIKAAKNSLNIIFIVCVFYLRILVITFSPLSEVMWTTYPAAIFCNINSYLTFDETLEALCTSLPVISNT